MSNGSRPFLSFGGGVNSVALGLWLIDHGIEAEWVYADHGADWPETREYVAMLQAKGYPITVLETRRGGLALYDYYWQYSMIPSRVARACTRLYKLVPLSEYMEPPCDVYIGIDAGESYRVERLIEGQRPGEEKLFPLVDHGIDRAGCTEIIKAHGLPVPIKSGCYVCPFQRVGQVRELRTLHKDLFERALMLERRANAARPGRGPYYLVADKPLDAVAMDDQPDLWGERDMTPCLCEI